jgi:hypothetical protein
VGLLDWVFGLQSNTRTPTRDEAVAGAIIERVVDATDARLKLVPNYRKVLRDSALTTLDHVRQVLQAIPGPVAVSAAAWTSDRVLRAFFARAADVPMPFSRSRDVRSFFAATAAEECIALLGFERAEREVIATRVEGDGVQREAVHTTVSFDKPVVVAPTADLQATRIELGKRTVDYLAMKALAQITALKAHKKELEDERALLKMRLQMAHAAGRGLAGMVGEAGVASVNTAALARDLEANEQALARYAATGMMAPLMDRLREVLGDPGAWLRVDTHTLELDDMNVKTADAGGAVIKVPICELCLVDRSPYAVTMARFPRVELLPEQDLWRAAERM